MRTSVRKFVVACVAVLGSMALSAGVAQARVVHEPIGSPLESHGTQPTGVAINQATQNIYVANETNGVSGNVVELNPAGTELLHEITFGKEAGKPFGQHKAFPAVDNDLASASTGDLYVPDAVNNVLDKFTSEGVFVCELNEAEAACPGAKSPKAFSGPEAVAVDPSTGNVYVSDTGNNVIDVFSPTGAYLTQFIGEGELTISEPRDIKVDKNGNVYLAARTNQFTAEGHTWGVLKFTPSTEPATGATTWAEAVFETSSNATAIGIDSESNVYVANESSVVTEHKENGEGLSTLNVSVEVPLGYGLAVNDTSKSVYYSNFNGNNVFVYDTYNAATFTTGGASEVKATSAKVEGTVNPENQAIAKCYFEYGAAQQQACEPPAASLSGASEVPVSAKLTGLEPGKVYHYKLVVEVAGAGHFPPPNEQEFTTTTGEPLVISESSSHVERHNALLSGEINPENQENGAAVGTTYYFEYGEAEKYDQITAAALIPAPGGLLPVMVGPVALIELKPGTVYHYRLVAKNGSGTTTGLPTTFMTQAPQPPSVIVGSETSAQVTPTTATVGAQVEPNGLQTNYILEVGTEVKEGKPVYSTPTFGAVPEGGQLSFSLTNLLPATLYHFHVVVFNEDGTVPGPDATFTTPGFPPIILAPPPIQIVPIPPEVQLPLPKAETRREKYIHAVKLCKRIRSKSKRAACLRRARKNFGPVRRK